MKLQLSYDEILNAIRSHYATYENLKLSDIKLSVKWDQEYDSEPDQADFSATAKFEIK